MTPKTIPDFIVIDDDPINNIICLKVIQVALPGADVKTFTDPEKGLNHIQSTYARADAGNAVLFLDINMPSLTGWDVLDRFNNFTNKIKGHVKIFMLSSSVNSSDKDRALENKLVSGYLSKPLSENKLRTVLPDRFNSLQLG